MSGYVDKGYKGTFPFHVGWKDVHSAMSEVRKLV